ncbi:MAG: inositol monophosphatase [Chloroflexia bacterium]|nr:inositol monophosphatase [Chloroflexia bacterium]
MDELAEYAEFAAQAARAAGIILRDRFGRPHEIRFKGAVDLVTEADRAAEALIAGMIRERYPDHHLLGEEGARGAASTSPFRWVVDPLDGTTNFAHNLPHFAVSIGLEHLGQPVVGAVYDPLRDELFLGSRGRGATLNGTPLQVSTTDDLLRSLLVTGFSYDLPAREHQAEVWRGFLLRVQAIRQTGSAALNLCYVAAGRLDGYWERGIAPWDVSAGAVVLREAGGTVTDFGGGPFRSDDRVVLASNGRLHEAMLSLIARFERETPPA